MTKRKKESMSSVLEEAHRRKHIASVGGDEDALPIYDNSNYHKEINRLLDNLYCLATGKKPDKSERKFEINETTKALIITLITMEGSKSDTFIANLRNERYNEITLKQKLDFFKHFCTVLYDLKEVPTDDELRELYKDKESSKPAELKELYHKDMKIFYNMQYNEIADDLLIADYVETIQNKVADDVKNTVDDLFSLNDMGGILFPLSYSDCDEEVFGSLSWKDTFEKSKLSVIDYDEKHRLLDMLYKSISGCINDWRNTVNKVCDAKLVDSSVLIEDII